MDKLNLLKESSFSNCRPHQMLSTLYSEENGCDFSQVTSKRFIWLYEDTCGQQTYPLVLSPASILAMMSDSPIHGGRVSKQGSALCVCDRFEAHSYQGGDLNALVRLVLAKYKSQLI